VREGSEGAETTINAEIREIAERFDGVGPAEQGVGVVSMSSFPPWWRVLGSLRM